MPIKLVSSRQACIRRARPTFYGICFGYALVIVGFVTSYIAFQHNAYFVFPLLLSASVFACFLTVTAYKLIREILCDYTLEFSDNEAIFAIADNLNNKKSSQVVLLSDIKYVEYYPYQDSASIIFHTSYNDLDVPLWPMGSHVQDVIDFLVGAGVKVIDVQSDESIPI